MKTAISIFLVATGLATSAFAAPSSSCFRMRDVGNHSVADAKTLYLSVRQKQVYKLTMKGACLATSSSSDPLITEIRGGGDTVCRPIDLDLKVDMSGMISPCIIDGVEKLTPEQVAAIPKKLRP